MKHLVGKDVTKEVSFMGETVTIRKLSTGRILEVQKAVADMNSRKSKKDDDTESLKLIRVVIKNGVIGSEDLTDEDFISFPLDELNDLVQEVLKYSGLVNDQGVNTAVEGN